MEQIRKLFRPLTRQARATLGTEGLAPRLDVVQQQLGRIESLLKSAAPEPAANQAPEPEVKFGPSYVGFQLPDGRPYELSIAAGADVYFQAVANGATQDAPWRFVTEWVKPGEVFFDLGANIGTFTIPIAVSGAEVHAFELLHENTVHILNSVRRNKLKNVSITLGATWDSGGCVGFAGYSAWGEVQKDTPISVATITVDDYVRQKAIAHVDTIKIDVEGSEKWALRGAVQLLQRDHPDVVIECNVVACGNSGYSYRELLSFLSGQGYTIYRFFKDRLAPCRPGEFQEIVYADYLASVRSPEAIQRRSGWKIEALSEQEVLQSVLDQDLYNEYHKAYVVANWQHMPEFIRNNSKAAALVEQWQPLRQQSFFSALQTGAA